MSHMNTNSLRSLLSRSCSLSGQLALRCSTEPHTLHPPPREREGEGREKEREREREREEGREGGEREREEGGEGEREFSSVKSKSLEHTALTKDKH